MQEDYSYKRKKINDTQNFPCNGSVLTISNHDYSGTNGSLSIIISKGSSAAIGITFIDIDKASLYTAKTILNSTKIDKNACISTNGNTYTISKKMKDDNYLIEFCKVNKNVSGSCRYGVSIVLEEQEDLERIHTMLNQALSNK